MSEETARELADALQAERDEASRVSALIQTTLDAIADGLPGHLEEHAKRLSHKQPDVAKTLGKDGVSALRAELAAAAEEIAADLRGAAEDIDWPIKPGVRHQDVHSALFNYLYKVRPVGDRLKSIFQRHGFAFHSTETVLPQYLYDQNNFGELPDALSRFSTVIAARKRAASNEDHAAVESLWDE